MIETNLINIKNAYSLDLPACPCRLYLHLGRYAIKKMSDKPKSEMTSTELQALEEAEFETGPLSLLTNVSFE